MKRIASKSAPSPTNAVSAENAIDVVIAWVDGRDPKHRRKRERYLADPGADDQPEQVASKERRFSDNDEIRFCLRSIRNYAPWVCNIWLVTDNQVPASIDRQQAELHNIRIVDHREIFRGHEELLPTYCLTASPDALEARLKQLSDGTMRMVCINHLEAVVDKVPDAMRYLSEATGPAAPFEKRRRRTYASRLRSVARTIPIARRLAIR